MLRITVNRSAPAAKKYYSELYYSEGKSRGDYYSEKDQLIGTWNGKAASKLGLSGEIKKEDFASLCDNQNPKTGKQLTERNNIERRVGYDFTFNASKSVSLAYTFGNEHDKKEILKAFQDSVKEAMAEIEGGMQTRVRVKGANENRETGNIAYGEFVHFTSRPVNGISDPHLHAHCFVFNVTHDDVEKKWKAGEFAQVKKDAPYYEAVFHSSLANKLQDLGYTIEKAKTGFEIKGISRETIEKFSLRTKEIEKVAKEKNITDKEDKAKIGAKTRESKRKSVTELEQEKNWDSRLTKAEKVELSRLKQNNSASGSKKDKEITAKDAVAISLEHHLERKSVTTDKEILATALKTSIGQASAGEIKKAFAADTSIISLKDNGQTLITNKAALHEENQLIAKAFDTKGSFKPINENYQPKTAKLNDEQRDAVKHALSTSDGISIIVGKAGTGKTTLIKDVQAGVRESGKNIFAFAPSANASRGVQREEGFENAETIAALLQRKKLQEQVKNSVIWIDEAGMVSNKDMNKILDIAKEQNARVILTGDTKQHSSVERGDALRILIKEAGIAPIQVSKIQRQQDVSYREAVSALSKSDVEKGFRKLDKMGAVHEIVDSEERIKKVALDYVVSTHGKTTAKNSKEVLVVSPTHVEGDKVTQEIRQQLKERNLIGTNEKVFDTYKDIQLTAAQKKNPENYTPGNWLIFNQNAKGVKAGSRFEIVGTDGEFIKVKGNRDQLLNISTDKADRYNVFEHQNIAISSGDKIRLTGNEKALDGKHLFNGTTHKVTGFDKEGNIRLANGSAISKDCGKIAFGYVSTSHASQGKTVDKVIVSQSTMSFRASSMEQFYVSVSRGKKTVAIYTDDKADLLKAVSQSNERKSAIELIRQKEALTKVTDIRRRKGLHLLREKILKVMDGMKTRNLNEKVSYGLQRNIAKETGRGR